MGHGPNGVLFTERVPPLSESAWKDYVAESDAAFAAMMKPIADALPARSSLDELARGGFVKLCSGTGS